MGSFSVEEFVGDGALKELVPRLVEECWDDVPTLKALNSDDMDRINMTQKQKDALELRSYLHDLMLMQYADRLESSGKTLAELLASTTLTLTTQFAMKRDHAAKFSDATSTIRFCSRSLNHLSTHSRELKSMKVPLRDTALKSASGKFEWSVQVTIADVGIKDGRVFKGVIASEPVPPILCGCVKPPPIGEDVAPYSSIENVVVERLTAEYRIGAGMDLRVSAEAVKASDLWKDKPAVLLCVRRPGCVMCRAEAHQLYARKPVFDALGFRLIAIFHEEIESEVKDFWPRYWGGTVVLDRKMDFFKALGGGKLQRMRFITALLNRRTRANYRRAKATGMEMNWVGEGLVMGGLFVVGAQDTGIAYQFVERSFGDWAPIAEVIDICNRLQAPRPCS